MLDIAGYPLLHLRSTRELLSATYDAFVGMCCAVPPIYFIYSGILTALQDAVKICKRVHRDVTPGNIILFQSPGRRPEPFTMARTGFMVDWDLSMASVEGRTALRDFDVAFSVCGGALFS